MPLPKFKEWLSKRKPSEENTQENAESVEEQKETPPTEEEELLDLADQKMKKWKIGPYKAVNGLNEATEDDLTAIKGIGPKTAQKILESVPVEAFDDLDLPAHIVAKLEAHFDTNSALQQE